MKAKTLWAVVMGMAIASTAAAQTATPSGVTASEVVAAHGFEHSRPVDPGTTFTHADARVFIAITADNTTAAEAEITVALQPASAPVGTGTGNTHLTIPASRRHYHTVARVPARPGQWRAVVRDASGNVLGQVEFTVTE
jgi:hypothetical protein